MTQHTTDQKQEVTLSERIMQRDALIKRAISFNQYTIAKSYMNAIVTDIAILEKEALEYFYSKGLNQ